MTQAIKRLKATVKASIMTMPERAESKIRELEKQAAHLKRSAEAYHVIESAIGTLGFEEQYTRATGDARNISAIFTHHDFSKEMALKAVERLTKAGVKFKIGSQWDWPSVPGLKIKGADVSVNVHIFEKRYTEIHVLFTYMG